MREGQHQANLKITGDAKSADKEVQILVKRIAELESNVERSNASLVKLEKRLAASKDSTGQYGKAVGFLRGEMFSAMGAIGVGGVVGGGVIAGLSILGSKMNEVAERTANVSQVFQTLKISVSQASEATEHIISNLELAQKANELMVSGVPLTSERFAELARATMILGDTMGKTMPQAMESMTEAITKASALRLDNLGVIVDEEQAVENWANANGRLLDSMSDVEKTLAKQQAFIDAIVNHSKTIEYSTKNTAGVIDRMQAAWENWKDNSAAVLTNNQNYLEKTRQVIPEVEKLDRKTIELLASHKGIALQQTNHRGQLEKIVEEIEKANGKYRTTEDLYAKITEHAAAFLAIEQSREQSGAVILEHLRESTAEMQRQVRIAGAQQKELLQVQITALKDIAAMRGLDAKEQEKATLAMLKLVQEQQRIEAAILQGEGKTTDAKKIRIQLQIEDLQLEQARTKSQKDLTALAKQEVELRAQLLEADGKIAEAMELRRNRVISDATKRTKEKVDPRAPFKQILIEAENAERLRAFGSKLEEIRNDEIKKERDHQTKIFELQQKGISRQSEIDEIKLEAEAYALERSEAGYRELAALEVRRIQLFAKREEAARESAEAELELREQFAMRLGDRETLLEIQAEREEINHQRMLSRYAEQMEIEHVLTSAEKAELEERARQRNAHAQEITAKMQAAASTMMSISASVVDAGRRAREAGENETKARRIAAGEALISISRQFAGQAIAHGIQAAANYATFNYVAGAQHTAAAALYGAGAIAMNVTGRGLVAEGGGNSGGGPSVASRPAPPPPRQPNRENQSEVFDTPDSELSTDTSGQRRRLDAEMASSRRGGGGLVININAQVVDDKVVREVFKRGKELQRSEGIEVPTRRRVGS